MTALEGAQRRTGVPIGLGLGFATAALGATAGAASVFVSWQTVLAAGAAAVLGACALLAGRASERLLHAFILAAAALAAPAAAAADPPTLVLAVGATFLALVILYHPWIGVWLLVLGIPFHVLVHNVLHNRLLLDVEGFTYWKEAAIAALALRAAASFLAERTRARGPISLAPFEWGIVAILALGCAQIAFRSGLALSVRGFSASLAPLVLYVAIRFMPRPRAFPRRAVASVVCLFALAGVFALVESLLLGDPYVQATGYAGSRSFEIPDLGVRRAISIFLDPLPLSFTMLLGSLTALSIAASSSASGRRWMRHALLAVPMILALVLSFTRATWVGLALGVALLLPLARARGRVLAPLFAAAILAVPALSKVAAWASSAARIADSSIRDHLGALARSVEILERHPLGLGLGRAGEVSIRLLGDRGIMNESWYLQIGTELGVAGLALAAVLVPLLAVHLLGVAREERARPSDPWRGPLAAAALAAWVALAGVALVHHVWAERAVSIPFWALVGLIGRTGTSRDGEDRESPG